MDGMINCCKINKAGFKVFGCGIRINAARTGLDRKKALQQTHQKARSTNPPIHASSIVLASTGTIERSPYIFGNPMPYPELSGRIHVPGKSAV